MTTSRAISPVSFRLILGIAVVGAVLATTLTVPSPAFATECTITGTSGHDVLTGTEGDDVICGGSGNDVIDGLGGDDTLTGGAGDDTLRGFDGNDAIDGGDGNDVILGDAGNDILVGGNGVDALDAGGGDDSLTGGSGDDTMDAGPGDDQILANEGHDRVSGGDGRDRIDGGPGNDRLVGDSGDDSIVGASGHDFLDGGDGLDDLGGGDGNDTISGGENDDTIVAFNGNDIVDGGAGNDTISGDNGNDSLLGGTGNDAIGSGNGNDTIVGGPGNDSHDGGPGNDTCQGGTGVNTFVACETQSQDPTPEPGPDPEPEPVEDPDVATWVDTDGDLLPDHIELKLGANPLLVDTDADGLTDSQEFLALTEASRTDSDGDGIDDSRDDEDGDSVTNVVELSGGTNPIMADSDDDGLDDGEENALGTDPLTADTDADGLFDADEIQLGSNPLLADEDGNGVLDSDESVSVVLELAETGASAVLQVEAGSALSARLSRPEIEEFQNVPGLRASPVDVHVGGVASGTVTIPFDAAAVSRWDDLVIVHFNEDTQSFDIPDVQTVDREAGLATVTTDDFSPFFLVERYEFSNAMSANDDLFSESNSYRPRDVIIAFNTSDNLAGADPSGRMEPAVLGFIDALPEDATVAVIDFGGRLVQALTSDRSAAKTAIRNLEDDAPTDPICAFGANPVGLVCVMDTAFRALPDDQTGGILRRGSIFVIDDGTVAPLAEPIQDLPISAAEHSGHRVYGIPFGANGDTDTWQRLADYSFAWNTLPTLNPADLASALATQAEAFVLENRTTDTDGDGISDYVEYSGATTIYGTSYRSDRTKADSDGDGLTDGEELGQLLATGNFGTKGRYQAYSDPSKFDTDGDGLGDGQEYDLETKPRLRDSDGDSLTDLNEVSFGFDPLDSDSDQDARWDDQEYAEGTDPFIYDFDFAGNLHAAFSGLIFGDAWNSDWARELAVTVGVASNGWYLTGQILSGFVVLGDLRDMVAGVVNGTWGSAALAAVAIVPAVGDLARTAGISVKFAAKSTAAVYAALPVIKILPEGIQGGLRQQLALLPGARFLRDAHVPISPPVANFDINAGTWTTGARKISNDPSQAAALQGMLDDLVQKKIAGSAVFDVRVNQQQVSATGKRIGINRPDLQYTLEDKRYYVEFDRRKCGAGNELITARGEQHGQRILNNDPEISYAAQVVLLVVGNGCDR